jgi:hypothetical protein
VLAASIIRVMSRLSVNFYHITLHNIPEDGHLHTHCCEKLKVHSQHLVILSPLLFISIPLLGGFSTEVMKLYYCQCFGEV